MTILISVGDTFSGCCHLIFIFIAKFMLLFLLLPHIHVWIWKNRIFTCFFFFTFRETWILFDSRSNPASPLLLLLRLFLAFWSWMRGIFDRRPGAKMSPSTQSSLLRRPPFHHFDLITLSHCPLSFFRTNVAKPKKRHHRPKFVPSKKASSTTKTLSRVCY